MDNSRVRDGLASAIFSLRFYLMNLDLAALPSIEARARRDLPLVPSVYFILPENKPPLYIGEAMNLRARWQHHHHSKNALAIEARIAWLELEPANLILAESVLIQIHRPIWNMTGKCSSSDDFLLATDSERFRGMWR